MSEILQKLSPHRDLVCYFERPSAIAALSNTSPTGFTVSGTWRQQFDWAVIEWNRDNTFEHPDFRYLPDGDLSGLQLSYEESRDNCIALDADWYPTVDWPSLRIWVGNDLYKAPLKDHATAVAGSYQPASVEFELQGTPTSGDYVGLAWLSEHHTHQLYGSDTLDSIVQALVDSVNAFSTTMTATKVGTRIRLTRAGNAGANGNRVGVYSFVSGAMTEAWNEPWQRLSGGTSPTRWRIDLDFANLHDVNGVLVPTTNVRKMRWTYSADVQEGAFERSEFQVTVSNWTVTGANRSYAVAGPGSRRIEDGDPECTYTGSWAIEKGNYSGGTIRWTSSAGASVRCQYGAGWAHSAYLGARLLGDGAQIAVTVDNGTPVTYNLQAPGEDVLIRLPLGQIGAGNHTIYATHSGPAGSRFYFDFLELAVPSAALPAAGTYERLTLATDWDTDHSIALPPERTAWAIHSLGFTGRANHYAGALWFYELVRPGQQYATATADFPDPAPNEITELNISGTPLQHLNLIGDTAGTVAKAFEFEINRGSTGVRAAASGSRLTMWARAMGTAGNLITLSAGPAGAVQISGASFSGGIDGDWRTDVNATPRLNRAARDWSRSYFAALESYGIDNAAAFSMELQHADPSPDAGIAQRYPSGSAVLLNTPAVQTNFSPASSAFWKQVYLEMAQAQQAAGCRPYLQFGEVQWWYFPHDGSGMPFYDTYTKDTFRSAYGREIQTIQGNDADPAQYADEAQFLPQLIGAFTDAAMDFVRASYPDCRFEVLYPTDVNATRFNSVVNYPASTWTPVRLDCLKTESFTYTYERNLDRSLATLAYATNHGFPASKRSHLVGISDPTTPWWKEAGLALGEQIESVVLFALDQFCLVGYALPLPEGIRRSVFLGA